MVCGILSSYSAECFPSSYHAYCWTFPFTLHTWVRTSELSHTFTHLRCFLSNKDSIYRKKKVLLLPWLIHHPLRPLLDWHKLLHCRCSSRVKWPESNSLIHMEIQKESFGSDRINQHCVNFFSKCLNVTDVHLYESKGSTVFSTEGAAVLCSPFF